MADRETRDRLLDDLQEALDEWYENEKQRLEDEATFMRSVLRGRTGSERLSRNNTALITAVAQDDINTFLTG